MIKAKELRIGNLLTHDARTCSVTSLIENGESNYDIETRFVKGGEVRFNSIIYVGLEPIPLTEEWLIKFGFEVRHETKRSAEVHGWSAEFIIDSESKRRFTLSSTNPDSNWGSKQGQFRIHTLDVWIKHVNQLQNLYFALTGEELIIK